MAGGEWSRWGERCIVCPPVGLIKTGDIPMHDVCLGPKRSGSCSRSRSMGSMALDRYSDHPAAHIGTKNKKASFFSACSLQC